MKRLLFWVSAVMVVSFGIFLAMRKSGEGSKITYIYERPKTADELREELRQQELANPRSYLYHQSVSIRSNIVLVRKGNLFRRDEYGEDGKFIEGYILNKASLAKFKDVSVTVSYYSATETLIQEKQFTIYQYFEPNSRNSFSIKIYPPSDYSSYRFSIKGATAAN
jgi:hypothetical protein